jgi:hypothetical protein
MRLHGSGVAEHVLAFRDAEHAIEPLDLELEDAATERREAVVAPALVVVAGALRRHFRDQPGARHPLDGTVQRAGTHADCAGGRFLNLTGDGVAVPLAAGEREQDVEDGGREWKLAGGIRRWHGPVYP